jgi:hypothetical protein
MCCTTSDVWATGPCVSDPTSEGSESKNLFPDERRQPLPARPWIMCRMLERGVGPSTVEVVSMLTRDDMPREQPPRASAMVSFLSSMIVVTRQFISYAFVCRRYSCNERDHPSRVDHSPSDCVGT